MRPTRRSIAEAVHALASELNAVRFAVRHDPPVETDKLASDLLDAVSTLEGIGKALLHYRRRRELDETPTGPQAAAIWNAAKIVRRALAPIDSDERTRVLLAHLDHLEATVMRIDTLHALGARGPGARRWNL